MSARGANWQAWGAPLEADRIGVRTITTIAILLALVIAVLPPVAYYSRGVASVTATLRIQAQLISGQVNTLIMRSPDSWQMQELRLRVLLTPDGVDLREPEIRRIIGIDGAEASVAFVENLGLLAWPRTSERVAILDQSVVVGFVEIERSMRMLFVEAVRLSVVTGILALACFAFLRIIPLRLLRNAVARATWLAAHDPLTGLANRAVLRDRLSDALTRAWRDRTTVAVLCLDLDHFKDVNDTLGHASGDRLLNLVVMRLKDNIRAMDTLARLGGDEFAIVQSGGCSRNSPRHWRPGSSDCCRSLSTSMATRR
ncbi:MAG: GGDEF domain-containing protein [Pseudomonadota bacterium]